MSPVSDHYRFLGLEISLWSAKIRPALRYKQLHFVEERSDIDEIRQRTGLSFIPVVVTPEGETWQDTSVILDLLEARHPTPPLFPRTPVQRLAAYLVELYADEFSAIPAMHTRWGTPERVAWTRARFAAQVRNREFAERAATAMMKRRDRIGVSPETAPAIDAHIRDLLDALSAHFENHSYLLGERMSLADCSLMGPIHGHFFTDLESRSMLLETAVPVASWDDRCNVPNADFQGEWLDGDVLAPSFFEVLAVMGRDAAPVILACLRDLEAWLDENPGHQGVLPPAVGSTTSELRGRALTRMTLSYSLWMVQRTLDAYAELGEDERARVDAALEGSGWEGVLAYRPRHRIEKDGFQLVLARSS